MLLLLYIKVVYNMKFAILFLATLETLRANFSLEELLRFPATYQEWLEQQQNNKMSRPVRTHYVRHTPARLNSTKNFKFLIFKPEKLPKRI
ncbi:unnamed protein product [Cylicocyclus nassatus]|uniref:Uncharacterized protein n=1 Tax=Cylicocyclus nassatus TaxID=53992 RepID=A0AA36DPX1_CYLNA|nr:unnamed protein product [Cylicocyclus nassatus]